jgi:drug/metabolite transporter (DMT)-like permease
VVGWVWLRHGERPSRLTVAGAVAAVAGLVMVLNLTGSVHVDPLGVLWGLLAACGLATYFVISAASAGGATEGGRPAEPLPPIAMAWGGMCVGAAVLAALGVTGALPLHATGRPVHFLDLHVSWIVPVLGLSLIAAVVAYVAGIGAARRLGAKLASFIGMTEVLFAILFAWLALGQLPTPIQFVGGALILAGIVLVRAGESSPVPATADEAEVDGTQPKEPDLV